jgi:hypothetical protein
MRSFPGRSSPVGTARRTSSMHCPGTTSTPGRDRAFDHPQLASRVRPPGLDHPMPSTPGEHNHPGYLDRRRGTARVTDGRAQADSNRARVGRSLNVAELVLDRRSTLDGRIWAGYPAFSDRCCCRGRCWYRMVPVVRASFLRAVGARRGALEISWTSSRQTADTVLSMARIHFAERTLQGRSLLSAGVAARAAGRDHRRGDLRARRSVPSDRAVEPK